MKKEVNKDVLGVYVFLLGSMHLYRSGLRPAISSIEVTRLIGSHSLSYLRLAENFNYPCYGDFTSNL